MKRIFVDVRRNETRVAVIEDGELVELYFERPIRENLVGNIYIGKVSSVLPGMQASFVDIGYERNAFLYLADAVAKHEEGAKKDIKEVLKVGQEVIVQVKKEAIGTKGPRVTTHLTLPGKYFVLTPNNDYIGVSLKIENEEERERLREISTDLLKEGLGLIIRTDAENKEKEDLKKDIDYLYHLYDKMKINKAKKGNVPRCIYKEQNIAFKSIRDLLSQDVDEFIINDADTYDEILAYINNLVPEYINKIKFENDKDLFHNYSIEPIIKKAVARKVWLKCGGYIVIDKTEALTVIDVNTGKYIGNSSLEETVAKTNMQAATEIAKQLRLRDISGIIIIDFIDMQNDDNKAKVVEVLREALKRDRTKTNILGMTGLGLIEMTRKKIRQGLEASILVECECCNGDGKVFSPMFIISDLENRMEKILESFTESEITFVLNEKIAQVFNQDLAKDIKAFENKYEKCIRIKADDKLDQEEMIIV